MIKDYFGLAETPFTRYVPPANLYRGQARQELSARLDHIVKNRALGVITGEVGDPPKVGGEVHRGQGALSPPRPDPLPVHLHCRLGA